MRGKMICFGPHKVNLTKNNLKKSILFDVLTKKAIL
jgi:hypothetical protein